MRVLFLTHRHQDLTISGVAEFLHYLPLTLKKFNIESFVYTPAESTLTNPVTLNNGMRSYSGPFLKPSWWFSRKKLAPLLQLCKQEKIDVIHAQGLYRSGYIAMLINRILKIPYIITSHSDVLTTNSARIQRSSVRKRCEKILQHASAATHLTPFMAEASHAIFNAQNKSYIIGNGIEISSWQKHHNTPEKNHLMAIGRLEPEKGFHVLIDAYAELRKHHPGISFVIAGTGSAETALQTQAKQLGLNIVTHCENFADLPSDSIIFTGYLRGEIKNQLMSEAKIILFATQPSQWEEPFGIVQIEAMAAKKPLISSDIAAARYLQQLGSQAILVDPSNSMAWTNQMIRLLNDSALRKKLGDANWQHAQQFDWEIVARQYATVYQDTLKI